MNNFVSILCGAAVLTAMCGAAATAWAADPAPIRVVVIGDSAVCNFDPAKSELRGWGQILPDYLKRPAVEVNNLAMSGRSSKSFLLEGQWGKVMKLSPAPNYILIQFAGNDIVGKGPERETLPDEVPAAMPKEGPGSRPVDWYRNNIRTYFEDARKIGAIPVMVTSAERPQFRKGVPLRKNLPYADAAKAVAREMNVTVIDLESYSFDVYSRLGLQGCEFMHVFKNGKMDSHYREIGARIWAEFIAAQLAKQVPALAPAITLPAQSALDAHLTTQPATSQPAN